MRTETCKTCGNTETAKNRKALEATTFTRGYKLNERKLICVSLTFTWGCKTELLAVTKMIAPRDIGEQWEFYCADGQVYRCWAESIVDMVVTV